MSARHCAPVILRLCPICMMPCSAPLFAKLPYLNRAIGFRLLRSPFQEVLTRTRTKRDVLQPVQRSGRYGYPALPYSLQSASSSIENQLAQSLGCVTFHNQADVLFQPSVLIV